MRRVLWLTSQDPSAKLLLFSSWKDVLALVSTCGSLFSVLCWLGSPRYAVYLSDRSRKWGKDVAELCWHAMACWAATPRP